jgi:glycosyltransferase involved in cell wall biosynthesis
VLNIITITKDDFPGITKTINSTVTLREKYDVKQIIVDSSSNPVKSQVQLLSQQSKNIEYCWKEPIGISQAFNTGIEKSTSDWIWFINGGDEVHPDFNPQAFMSVINVSTADVIVFELEFLQSKIMAKHPPIWNRWPFFLTNWICHPATIIRRKLFNQYGLFNEEYKIAMDTDLWARIFSENIIVDSVSMPIVLFDQSGMSSKNMAASSREVKRIMKKNLGKMFKIWIKNGLSIWQAWNYRNKLSKSDRKSFIKTITRKAI